MRNQALSALAIFVAVATVLFGPAIVQVIFNDETDCASQGGRLRSRVHPSVQSNGHIAPEYRTACYDLQGNVIALQ